MTDFSFLKELGKELFLRATSDPSIRSGWICYETMFADSFIRRIGDGDEDSIRLVVTSGLQDPYELPSPSLITPVLLYVFPIWFEMGTAWDLSSFNGNDLCLWATLEDSVILGGADAFEGDGQYAVRCSGQQYYGLRPTDLRGFVDEATCLEIQRFLYMREKCLAWAIPAWADDLHPGFCPDTYQHWAERARARLADPNYNPLKFCPFDDDVCWDTLRQRSCQLPESMCGPGRAAPWPTWDA